MGKRVLKVRNALTGKVREVVVPGRPAAKKKPAKKTPTTKVAPVVKGDEENGPDNG